MTTNLYFPEFPGLLLGEQAVGQREPAITVGLGFLPPGPLVGCVRELHQASSLGEACACGRADVEDKMGGLGLRNGMWSDEGQDAQLDLLRAGNSGR